jgi:hypothetical protein
VWKERQANTRENVVEKLIFDMTVYAIIKTGNQSIIPLCGSPHKSMQMSEE